MFAGVLIVTPKTIRIQNPSMVYAETILPTAELTAELPAEPQVLTDITPVEETKQEVYSKSISEKMLETEGTEGTEYRNLVAMIAAPAGVSIDLVERIIKAESNGNPLAKNPNSTATGLTQILIGTWNYFGCFGSRTDPSDNIRCAVKILKESGEQHWDSSKHIWGVTRR